MESVNMFPVFRLRDGFGSRDRNDEVFEFCRQKLIQGRVVTIYVEGEHHLEYRVRPIQKGIARIAFGTLEQQDLPDLQIIPAGCNYLFGDRPRDEVMLNVGAPIYLRDYLDEYLLNPAVAMKRLLADIETGLKQHCLHVDDPADDALAAQLLTLCRSNSADPLLPIVVYSNKRFSGEKAVCDQLNRLQAAEKIDLSEQTDRYFQALYTAGLRDDALVHPEWARWWYLMLFTLGLIPFAAGYFTSFPIIWLARYATNKLVKKREFRSSVQMGIGHFSGMIYYLLWVVGSLITCSPWWIAFALALPGLGWFSMYYRENWTRWITARRAIQHPEQDTLREMRAAISFPFPTNS